MTILEQMLEGTGSVAILGHIRPDGDCLGSALGLYNYLRLNYPAVRAAVYLEEASCKFGYLQGFDEIRHQADEEVYGLCVCLDCGDLGRLGGFAGILESAGKSLCLDHHVTNTRFADTNLVEDGASSTCEVLYGQLDSRKIDRTVAECLYTGIVHDTGVFKHSNTTKKTMIYAGELMEKGVPHSKIIDETFFQKTYIQNLVLGKALLNSRLFCGGAVIFASLSQEELDELHASPADLNGIIDQLRITKDVETAVFVYPLDDGGKKVSMRSNGKVNVASIAQEFGGGGHILAAGCTVFGDVEEVREQLFQKIKIQL